AVQLTTIFDRPYRAARSLRYRLPFKARRNRPRKALRIASNKARLRLYTPSESEPAKAMSIGLSRRGRLQRKMWEAAPNGKKLTGAGNRDARCREWAKSTR